ncbi:hypothetical protein [Escherichia coli]|uniref:hypothetical protein n=1 Tax=Escherichia coli TaxID=562 RepID=UPI0039A68FE5
MRRGKLTRRRDEFAVGFAQPVLTAFLEELHEEEDLPLPAGAPDFLAARAAYTRAHWMGPGRGWVDPVAEKKGAILAMEAGMSTLEIEVAENVGKISRTFSISGREKSGPLRKEA